MKMTLSIADYSVDGGFAFEWEHGFTIDIKVKDRQVLISANKAGLISFAKNFLSLAQDNVPSKYHFHLDENNSLEEGSYEIIVQKD